MRLHAVDLSGLHQRYTESDGSRILFVSDLLQRISWFVTIHVSDMLRYHLKNNNYIGGETRIYPIFRVASSAVYPHLKAPVCNV